MQETSNRGCLWAEQTYSALTLPFQLCTVRLAYLLFSSPRNCLHTVKSQSFKVHNAMTFKSYVFLQTHHHHHQNIRCT